MARAQKAIPETDREMAVAYLRAEAPAFAAKIAPVYALLKWQWTAGKEAHVPDEHEIRDALFNLIAGLLEMNVLSQSSGGLRAWIERGETGQLDAGISLTIDENYYG